MNYAILENLLKKRLEIIGDDQLRKSDPQQQLTSLQEVSEQIDAWREQHRGQIPSRLRHFLDQYSLDKALVFIQSEGESDKC